MGHGWNIDTERLSERHLTVSSTDSERLTPPSIMPALLRAPLKTLGAVSMGILTVNIHSLSERLTLSSIRALTTLDKTPWWGFYPRI